MELKKSIQFDEKAHRYYNPETGEEYVSVTTFIGKDEPFDEAEAIRKAQTSVNSIYYGQEAQEIKEQWVRIRDTGTALHKEIERFLGGATLADIGMEHRQAVYNFSRGKFQGNLLSEVRLWSHKLKIAGTCDLITEKEVDGVQVYTIYDFKTSTSINRWKLEKYAKQLWLYKTLLEEMLADDAEYDKELFGGLDVCCMPSEVKVGGIIHFVDYINNRREAPKFVRCESQQEWVNALTQCLVLL